MMEETQLASRAFSDFVASRDCLRHNLVVQIVQNGSVLSEQLVNIVAAQFGHRLVTVSANRFADFLAQDVRGHMVDNPKLVLQMHYLKPFWVKGTRTFYFFEWHGFTVVVGRDR
jgi:hypothetical protein